MAGDDRVDRSHPMQLGLPFAEPVSSGEAMAGCSGGPALPVDESRPVRVDGLFEQFLAADNLERALQRVVANAGAAGVDGMGVHELVLWWPEHSERLVVSLREGSFRPSPVRRVEIPKPGEGRRLLGVPTVVDRVVQQAITQVLTPIFDPGFSEHSYGFRPGRSAHQAVRQAQQFLEDGFGWVVDVDLDAFFDRVNHDKLMHRVWRRVADKRLLRLVRAFLEAGIMVDGVRQASVEGTPQGSPLSPLLSNIMLDDLDRELERRGHRFVRYADDLRIYLGSERAAWRVLDGITRFVEGRLALRVNQNKSTVVRLGLAVLLGFGFYRSGGKVKIRVDPGAVKRFKVRIRRLTRRHGGESIRQVIGRVSQFVRGWTAYFRIADTATLFERLDGWLRRRLRAVQWALWKTSGRRLSEMRKLGCPVRDAFHVAYSRAGTWDLAASTPVQRALSNDHWRRLGLVTLTDIYHRPRNH